MFIAWNSFILQNYFYDTDKDNLDFWLFWRKGIKSLNYSVWYAVNKLLFAFKKFSRCPWQPASSSRVFPATNQSSNAFNIIIFKVILIATNQFISSMSQNKVVANKNWFTVLRKYNYIYIYYILIIIKKKIKMSHRKIFLPVFS